MATKKNAKSPKAPQGWRAYTQAMADEDLAAGHERPTHNVGQLIPDRVVGAPGGQQYVRMGNDPGNPDSMLDYTAYKKTINPNGAEGDFWKGMAMILGGAAAGGMAAGGGAAGLGADAVSGAAFDPGMFGAADWAGSPVFSGAGDVAGGATGSTFGGNGGGMFEDFFNFDPNIGDYNPGALDTPNLSDPFSAGGGGGGAPYQPGYNQFDPSTYGGGSGGGMPTGSNGVTDMLKKLLGGRMGAGGPGGNGPGGGTGGGNNIADMLGMIMALNSLFGDKNEMDPTKMNALWGAGMDTYNAGRDPQNALRNRTQGRIIDQTRAGQSARGLAMSPYAAGGEAEAAKNFNIDWQNQQLNRQKTGFDALALASGGYFNQANQDRNFNTGQNTAATNALLTGGSNLLQPGGWLNGLFGGNAGGATGGDFGFTPPGGGDPYGAGGQYAGASPSQDAFGYTDWSPQYQQAYNSYGGGP